MQHQSAMRWTLFLALLIYTGVTNRFIAPLPDTATFLLPAALIVVAGFWFSLSRRLLFNSLLGYAPLLLLALASIIWTESLGGTILKLASTGALILTAAALLASTKDDGQVVGKAIVYYGLFHSVASLALIYFAPSIGQISPTNLIGVASHKSALTNISALGAVAAVSQILSQRKLRLVPALTVLSGCWVLAIGGGGQAILGLLVATAVSALLALRAKLLARGVMLASAATAMILPFYPGLIEIVSDLTGKDVTISGRTYLWEMARSSFYDHPWLGIGYLNVGNLEGWQATYNSAFFEAFGSTMAIPNLHNQWIEVAFMLGIPGLLVAAYVLVLRPTMSVTSARAFPAAILAFAYVQSAFGSNFLINTAEALIYAYAICALTAKAVVVPFAQPPTVHAVSVQ